MVFTSLQSVVILQSPCPQRLAQVLGKIFEHAKKRIRRRLAQTADRSVTHHGGKLSQASPDPTQSGHSVDGPLGADTACIGRTLVLEEVHQVVAPPLSCRPGLEQNHNRMRPDEAACIPTCRESRGYPPSTPAGPARSAAGQITLEDMTIGQPAAKLIDQSRAVTPARKNAPDSARPETEKPRKPLRSSPPLRTRAPLDDVARTQNSVSTFCSSARPAGTARLAHRCGGAVAQAARACPRSTSIIVRISSPQMYAPAPRRRSQLGICGRQTGLLDLGGVFVEQQRRQLAIFVAQIKIDFMRLNHPGGDQHAFDEAVRIEAEIVAILERAGLALVAIHGHQARPHLCANQRPFAARREARATETAQTELLTSLISSSRVRLPEKASPRNANSRLAADVGARKSRCQVEGIRVRVGVRDRQRRFTRSFRRFVHLDMSDGADRCLVTSAHAWRAHDADSEPRVPSRQVLQQAVRSGHERKTTSCKRGS